jgi:hypothetical protein
MLGTTDQVTPDDIRDCGARGFATDAAAGVMRAWVRAVMWMAADVLVVVALEDTEPVHSASKSEMAIITTAPNLRTIGIMAPTGITVVARTGGCPSRSQGLP